MATISKNPAGLPAAFGEDSLRALCAATRDRAWLAAWRAEAVARALELPPAARGADPWRRTDPARFALDELRPCVPGAALDPAALDPLLAELASAEVRDGLLAMLDGETVKLEASAALEATGTVLSDFRTAARASGETLRKQLFGGAPVSGLDRWSALSAAFATGGAYVRVPRGVNLESPLWVVHQVDARGRALFLHTVLHLEPGASATVVEFLHGNDASGGLCHQALDVRVEAGAQLRYLRIQELGPHTAHLSRERLSLSRDASAEWGWGLLGGSFSMSGTQVDLVGEGASARLSGFYHGAGVRHLDHHTFQNHVQGHTTSDLMYKGALEQQARSVFTGLIKVHADAQRSDAYLANKNLLLSPEARADSIPSLEIEANDVRCTHGATVGQLDEEQLFYLRSRGVPPAEAARLIVEGFYEPVFDRLGAEPLRTLARSRLQGRLTL